jgi:hypothetical protein
MPALPETQTFELRVRFTGLCLYRFDGKDPAIDVLMPDARVADAAKMVHADGTRAEAHVGFLSIEREFLRGTVPGARGDVVRRLTRESVRFALPASTEGVKDELILPNFSQFAPDLVLDPSLLTAAPAPTLLARVGLSGGTLSGEDRDEEKQISRVIGAGGSISKGKFQHVVTWSRTVPGTAVALELTTLDGQLTETIELQAARNSTGDFVAEVRVANLCAHNPLEWPGYALLAVTPDDMDFKWLHRLYLPRDGAPPVKYDSANQVPFVTTPRASGLEGIRQNCYGARDS